MSEKKDEKKPLPAPAAASEEAQRRANKAKHSERVFHGGQK
jgi:hypothetical protein